MSECCVFEQGVKSMFAAIGKNGKSYGQCNPRGAGISFASDRSRGGSPHCSFDAARSGFE